MKNSKFHFNKHIVKMPIALNRVSKGRLKAFTLSELLVVLCIIGILILLALPSLMPLISKAKSTEAQLQLKHVYTLEKSFFYLNSKYTNDFHELGFEQPTTTKEGGQANYKIEIISVTNNTFVVQANAIVDFDGDGVFNQWEINQNQQLKEKVMD
jgi:type IV pilus assembly protein PilE